MRENGSVANFYVDLVADPCPTVQWSFNGTMLGPTNDTFSYNDPCNEPGATSPNWRFMLDVLLSENTSGPFSAEFTNIAGAVSLPSAYFTIPSGIIWLNNLCIRALILLAVLSVMQCRASECLGHWSKPV